MKPSIYLKGIDELERKTNQIIKEVTSEKTKLLLKGARTVKERIIQKAESQQKSVKHSARKAAYAKAYPETTSSPAHAFAGIRPGKMPQAHLVEFGHGGPHPAPPHPFVRPAWDECREKVEQDIQSGLKKAIEGAV